MTHHEHHDDDERDFTERAADATEESRREAGQEGRTLEEQADPLSVPDEEGDGEISAY